MVEDVLIAHGFNEMGKGGRDEIKGQRTSFNFQGPNDLVAIIGVDRKTVVPIRINQNRKIFSQEASQIFNDVASALESRWPGSVAVEAVPTK